MRGVLSCRPASERPQIVAQIVAPQIRCTTDRCTTDRCTTAKTNVGRIAADTMRTAQRAEGALQRTLARREERAQAWCSPPAARS